MAKKELTSLKGYFGVVKAIVIDTEDPENLGRVRIQIPSYHGNTEDTDRLPWAQVCVNRTPASGSQAFSNAVSANGGGFSGVMGAIGDAITGDYATSSANLSMAPAKGDVVWVIFEGGDINYPLVIGVLYSTIGSGNSNGGSISDGDIAYLMAQIMMKYESNNNYGAFAEAYTNSRNEHAITIGAHQCYATHALQLLNYLRTLNQSEFDSIASPVGLLSDMQNADWSTYKISKSSAKAQAIIKIMTTSWGVDGQIKMASQDVQNYMNQARQDYNVTDIATILYICDIIHQYGRTGAHTSAGFRKGATYTSLEQVYQVVSKTYYNRRVGVYNDVKALRDSGKLNQNSSGASSDFLKKVVEVALQRDMFGNKGGYCQAWVADVYARAGQNPRASACCASKARDTWRVSTDRNNIPAGACVYATHSWGGVRCSCGRDAGHVGIYVGSGQVASNVGSIKVESLDSWINTYGWGGWGYNGGKKE